MLQIYRSMQAYQFVPSHVHAEQVSQGAEKALQLAQTLKVSSLNLSDFYWQMALVHLEEAHQDSLPKERAIEHENKAMIYLQAYLSKDKENFKLKENVALLNMPGRGEELRGFVAQQAYDLALNYSESTGRRYMRIAHKFGSPAAKSTLEGMKSPTHHKKIVGFREPEIYAISPRNSGKQPRKKGSFGEALKEHRISFTEPTELHSPPKYIAPVEAVKTGCFNGIFTWWQTAGKLDIPRRDSSQSIEPGLV